MADSTDNIKTERRLSVLKLGLAVLVIVAVWYAGQYLLTGKKSQGTALGDKAGDKAVLQKTSVFKQVSQPFYLPPKTLSFGKKILDVEVIGVETDGTLSVPASWQIAGWYKEGAKAGEEGNVIIDGHYDTNTGAPGAFWELKNLQLGDKVLLTDRLGRVYEYSVNGKSFVSITDPQRTKVFESSKDKVLTLITCGGVWDYASGTYNKRLVVTAGFAKMVKSW